jgi:hypothetical protein
MAMLKASAKACAASLLSYDDPFPTPRVAWVRKVIHSMGMLVRIDATNPLKRNALLTNSSKRHDLPTFGNVEDVADEDKLMAKPWSNNTCLTERTPRQTIEQLASLPGGQDGATALCAYCLSMAPSLSSAGILP